MRLVDTNGDVHVYTTEGALQAPTGIALDALGYQYVVDQATHAIDRISAVGPPIPHLWAGVPGTACPNQTATTRCVE